MKAATVRPGWATAGLTTPVCVSGRRAYPPAEVGGPSSSDKRIPDWFSWRYETLDQLLVGKGIREDRVPT